jgi:hypothetical protein
MPQIAKRGLPASSCDQNRPTKKAKVGAVPSFPIDDDEEYGSTTEKVISGLQKGVKAEKEFKFVKVEVKEEKKPKVELDAKVTLAI